MSNKPRKTTKKSVSRRRPTKKKPAPPRSKPAAATPSPKPDESIAGLKEQLEEKVAELTQTNRQLKRKIFDLYTIFEISRNFNAVLEYQTLLDTFIFTCLGQVGALKAAIFLKREAQVNRFYPVKCKGSGHMPAPDDYIKGDTELTRYLVRLNRPVPVSELISNIADEDERRILAHFNLGIVVPLIYQTRLTGLLAISEKIGGREFHLDDIEFLSILGNQISVAIENARLYEGEKELSLQLRTTQQQLLQTERLAALGEMSAKVAHEVNNPLGIINNYVQLLRRSCGGNDQAAEYVDVVNDEIGRIARIVKQLLDFHRPGETVQQPIDVVKVITDVLVLMQGLLDSARIEVTTDFQNDMDPVMATSESLKQVFLNLLINARDAMRDGGRLTVKARQDGRDVVMTFEDTGPGIPPEHISRIFEPFFTTKEPGEGTGLGLSVCYGIIKNLGGSISFKNLDSGGCFIIDLPTTDERTSDG